MAYTKTNWVNNETPINETNLNNIENGISDLYDAESVKGKYIKVGLKSNITFSSTSRMPLTFDIVLDNNFDDDYDNYFKLNSAGKVEIMNDKIKAVLVIFSYFKAVTSDIESMVFIANNLASIGKTSDTSSGFLSVGARASLDDTIWVAISTSSEVAGFMGQKYTYMQVIAI